MTKEMVTILFFVVAIVLYVIFLWQERRKIFMYRFYSLRDDLYRLAIEEKINENSITFKQLSMMLNITIAFSKKFKLKDFLKALEAKRLDQPHKNKAFFEDLEKQGKDVKKIAEDFFNNFFHLMVRNHPFLYVLIHVKFIMLIVPEIFRQQVDTALAYKDSAQLVNVPA